MSEFLQLVGGIQNGVLESDLDKEVRALVQKVGKTGKTGKLALEVTVEHGGDGRVYATGKIKATNPAENRASALFYVTPEGSLSRRDPQQAELPNLRLIEGGE